MVNVVCLKHSNKYGPEYVNKLYNMVARNLTLEFDFYCMTEDPTNLNSNINIIDLPDMGSKFTGDRKSWWYKMMMYKDGMIPDGPTLYLDLDVVIIKNIDNHFDFHPGEYCILQDFNRYKIPSYDVLNTSIVKFNANKHDEIWRYFLDETANDRTVGRLHGDQDCVTNFFKKTGKKFTHWPALWSRSWKWEITEDTKVTIGKGNKTIETTKEFTLPDECSVIVFHGNPKPSDPQLHKDFPIIKDNWQ